jgi:hypothetical protein
VPYLGDFLGQLMSELANARLRTDIESIRIAELYSSHELLRHFPVPRIRLPDVQVDVPVVTRAGASDGGGAHAFPSAHAVSEGFHAKAVEHLGAMGINLSPTRVRTLQTQLRKTAGRFEQPGEIPAESGRLSGALADATFDILTRREKERLSAADERRIRKDLGLLARKSMVDLKKLPSRLEVGVTAEEIREAGDAVTRIHLKISEEGLEWTSIETGDGKTIDRLVLE